MGGTMGDRIVLGLICLSSVFAGTGAVAKDRAPAADSTNTLTHGMVQMTLKVGQTSQLDVVEAFGAPNITTIDASGQEVWIYDRHASVTASKDSGFSIGILIGAGGGGVGGGAGLGFGSSKSRSSESTRSMTLIIKFGDTKLVTDFKSRTSSF
jgi:hypothetical protein